MDIISVALSKSYTNSVLNNLLQSGDLIKGEDGNGINKIEKINSENLIDTYRIYLDDNTTYDFAVTNGKDGLDGKSIISATIDSNNLFFGLSDGSTIPAGTITTLKGADGTTPTLTIGDVTTLDSDQQATVNITGTSQNPVLNFGIPKGKDTELSSITTTDEKVKLNSSSATAKYLEELIDNKTITIDTVNNVIKAISLDGLETTIATLNYIKNLDKDIMLYLNSVSNPMAFKGVVADDESLSGILDAKSGDTYIVQSSSSNSDKTMTFVFNGTEFVPMAETTIEVRDFSINPIDLSKETTGILAEEKIDSAIARLTKVLSKEIYAGSADGVVKSADTLKELTYTIAELNAAIANSHKHLNKTTLDKIIENGLGNRLLTDAGTYKELVVLSSTEPQDTYVLWVDTTSSTTPVLKIHDGTSWIAISGAGSSITISTADNNAIEIKDDGFYVKDKTHEIQALSDKYDTIKKYQKYVNTELDSCNMKLASRYTVVQGEYVPFIKGSGSMEVNNGRVIIKAGQRVQINISISYNNSSSNQVSNIQFYVKDYTNNKIIAEIQPMSNPSSSTFEFAYSQHCQYSNDTTTDCEVGLYVATIYTADILDLKTTMTIQEINRQITIDPVEYVNTTQGIEDTPVGHIIAHMGNTAPPHYLICNGSQVAVADYPHLAQHFIDEFGSEYYFGGSDGMMNLPDLRGEFLRGTGTATRNTGSGVAVGKHQDGTAIPNIAIINTGISNFYGFSSSRIDTLNPDKRIAGNKAWTYAAPDKNGWSSSGTALLTIRPTNTSVLYCIKASPTYFMQNIYTGNEEVVLWEGTTKIKCVSSKYTDYDIVITPVDSMYNYDEIRIYYGAYNSNSDLCLINNNYHTVNVADVIKYNDILIFLNNTWGLITMSVKCEIDITKNIFNITQSYLVGSSNNLGINIYKIVGIKTSLNENGELPNTTYTDEEIQEAVANVLGGAE